MLKHLDSSSLNALDFFKRSSKLDFLGICCRIIERVKRGKVNMETHGRAFVVTKAVK